MTHRGLTDAGRGPAEFPAATPTTADGHGRIRAVLGGVERAVFDALHAAGGRAPREALASGLGYHERTKSFTNALGRLRTLGVVEYEGGEVAGTGLMYRRKRHSAWSLPLAAVNGAERKVVFDR